MLETLLAAVAGLIGGFVSTLASNGSAITLPMLELFGLPEHTANGTNRLSVVALGLMGTIGFYREGLVDWRRGGWIAFLVALGTAVGSVIAVEFSEALLDAIIIAGLLLVLGMLLIRPDRWLEGKEGTLRPFGWGQAATYFVIGVYARLVVLGSGFFLLAALVLLTGCDLSQGNAMKAFILLIVGLQSLLIFSEAREVDWTACRTTGSGERRRGVRGRASGRQRLGQSVGLPLPRVICCPGDPAPRNNRQRKLPAARLSPASDLIRRQPA